jgi:hypothetical protein
MQKHYSIKSLGGVKVKTQQDALIVKSDLDALLFAFLQGTKIRYKYSRCQVQVTDTTVKLYMNHTKLVAHYHLSNSNEIFIDIDVNDFGFAGSYGGQGYRKEINYNETLQILKMITGFCFYFEQDKLFYGFGSNVFEIKNQFVILIGKDKITIDNNENNSRTNFKTFPKDSEPLTKSISKIRFKRMVSGVTGKELIQLFTTDENVSIILNGRKVY